MLETCGNETVHGTSGNVTAKIKVKVKSESPWINRFESNETIGNGTFRRNETQQVKSKTITNATVGI